VTTDVAPPSASAPPPQAAYPISLDVIRPETSSRLLNFPLAIGLLIRAILTIPHSIVLYFLGLVAGVLYLIATFAILFTGKFPQGMYNFVAGVMRWNSRVTIYTLGLVEPYPPFTTEDRGDYPVRWSVTYPEKSSRLLNFPVFGLLIKYILLLPHLVVVAFLAIVLYLILIIAPFAVLFTGRYPAGMHGFAVGFERWSVRLSGYLLALTDRYPPFSLS
jgi:hypothetical protein